MGEIADQMINGECCQFCLEPFDEPAGYPASCAGCSSSSKQKYPLQSKDKTNCPTCGKHVKKVGLAQHIKVVHSK